MADNLQFAIQIMDFAWFAAIAIRALSWMMLCHGPVWKWRHPGRAAAEAFTLAAALTVGLLFLALIGGRGLHLLPQLFFHGAAGALLLYLRSSCPAKSKLVMWCSMLAGSCTIYSISGQCSFLVGEFLSSGVAEGIVRTVVLMLVLPLAVYLHSFSLQEYEHVPASGLAAILIGGALVNKASIANVIIGTILFQGMVTMTPTIMNAVIHTDMSEVIRIIVSQGMILYALTRKTEGAK